MRIRTKLTLLLVTFAVGPLLVVSLNVALRTRALGEDLSTSSVDELRRRTGETVERAAHQTGSVVRSRLQNVETATVLLASALRASAGLEDAAGDVDTGLLVDAAALDAGRLTEIPGKYFDARPGGSGAAVPVATSLAAVRFAADGEGRARFAERRLLAGLARTVMSAWSTPGDLLLFAGVDLPSGTRMVYPAIGESSWPGGVAADRGPGGTPAGAVWIGPVRHASTGQWILRCVAAAAAADGGGAGLAWYEVLMQDLAAETELSLGTLGVDTEVVLVSEDAGGGRSAWRRVNGVLEPVPLESVVPGLSGEAGATAGGGGADDSMWSLRPAAAGLSVAVVVRSDVMASAARSAEERVLSQTASQVRFVGVAAGIVFALAVAVAYGAAKTVTRPIRRLADLTDRVAGGDYSAEVRVRGSDEISRLSRDIQSMIPKLAASVRQQETSAVAAQLQRVSMGGGRLSVCGFDVATYSMVADRSRGDHAHRIDLGGASGRREGVVIGDVSGEGIPAALLLASVKAVLTHLAPRHTAPGDLLTAANAAACEHATDGRFVAMLLVVFDGVAGGLRWANAGHEPPLLYVPERASFERLEGGGLPIGVDPRHRYETLASSMPAAGSVIYLGTDGVWDARNEAGEAFGRDRLMATIASCHACGAETIAHRIAEAIDAFRGGAALTDDVMFVVLRKLAEPIGCGGRDDEQDEAGEEA